MTTSTTFLVTVVLKGLVICCATTKDEKNTRSTAGFKMVPVAIREKEAHLGSLPAEARIK